MTIGLPPPDLLEAIVAGARADVAAREERVPEGVVEARAAAARPRGSAFEAAMAEGPAPRIIAECKRRSPSRGILREVYDPAAHARGYEAAGAAAVSVLTEPAFFDGALAHLEAVRAAVACPVLQKDFILTRYQLLEARATGADAVLLIAGALPGRALTALVAQAAALDLAALVEAHDEADLDAALEAGARLVGVNSRNLRTLGIDRAGQARLAARMPDHVIAVAESGIHTRGDLDALADLGFDAFLVGEHFMTAPDPGAALRAMRTAGAQP